ncbi:MAG TPA: SRPBCC domain-containing protein [Thermoplasmata archaeon]|nr:SRPBCC domain-containing protein [Thermoplasmata archaeon]
MSPKTDRAVDHRYFLRATPAAVFQAISDGPSLRRWLCDRAEIDPRKGGKYTLGWNDGPTHRGTILEFVPGQRISFVWRWPGVALAGTVLSHSIEARDDGTILHVRHSGFPRLARWTELYGGAEWGWTYFAMNLKSVLESGRDLRSPHDG